jgi:hypothetical protein
MWHPTQILKSKQHFHVAFCSCYYSAGERDQQYLDFLENGPSAVLDATDSETFMFLVIIIQMGHDICDNLKDCWLTT